MVNLAAKANDMRQVEPADLNRQPHLLNVNNGTIDLRTGELLNHERCHLITQLCPIEYQSDAQCPRFEKFIEVFLRNTNF